MYSSPRVASYYHQVSLSYTPIRLFASYEADCGSDDSSGGASQQQVQTIYHLLLPLSAAHESSPVRQLLEGHEKETQEPITL